MKFLGQWLQSAFVSQAAGRLTVLEKMLPSGASKEGCRSSAHQGQFAKRFGFLKFVKSRLTVFATSEKPLLKSSAIKFAKWFRSKELRPAVTKSARWCQSNVCGPIRSVRWCRNNACEPAHTKSARWYLNSVYGRIKSARWCQSVG